MDGLAAGLGARIGFDVREELILAAITGLSAAPGVRHVIANVVPVILFAVKEGWPRYTTSFVQSFEKWF